MLGPLLVGSRVTLAPTAVEHLPNFCRWFADPAVNGYTLRFSPPSQGQEEEWYDRIARSEKDVTWAILHQDAHIGVTGLHEIHWQSRHASSGIIIGAQEYWGRGLATEAMHLRTGFAFDELGLEKVITGVFIENVASRRALERVGYRQAGIHRRHYYRQGRWHDLWLGEILREDWQKQVSPTSD